MDARADRLQKIFALLDSPHEGEAIAAFLNLRAQLATLHTRLGDISPSSLLLALQQAEARNAQLEQEVSTLRSEAAAATKWKQLAQRTADQLWEIGRQLHALEGEPQGAKVVPLRKI